MRSISARAVSIASALVLLGALFAPAVAHEERESFFPDHGAPVPVHRTQEEATHVAIVCKEDSGDLIADIQDAEVRALNEELWATCGAQFQDGAADSHADGGHVDVLEHIQAAVDHVRETGPDGGGVNIYVLPGTYREEPSREAACNEAYDGGVVAYEDGHDCPTITQLVGIFGDDPADEDRVCDNPLCNLQLEGTGDDPLDVIVEGGFREDGEWIDLHNGIRADRADGFYLRNLTTQLVRENGMYVHETDGYVLDRVVGRAVELYGILTFASDHGLIKDCETYYNGDSGVYPGSPADVNADNDETGELERWAVEVTGCNSHHNALGFSGTAGNSVKFHDNDFHHNSAGYVTDSFVGGHPGMPQDHAWLFDNRIYSNNVNYYENVNDGTCDAPPRDWNILETGTVCPVFPVPVGTGVMIAGGNHNLVEDNLIYDNWRTGVMLFWVPTILRESPSEPGDFPSTIEDNQDQFEVSHDNWFRKNEMGESPDGLIQPNGTDFWWDDQGGGNCWEDNKSTATEDGTPTSNSPHTNRNLTTLPTCDEPSVDLPSNAVKSAGIAPCAAYDREDQPNPPGCDWFETPAEPAGREAGSDEAQPAPATDDGDDGPAAAPAESGLPATGGGLLPILLGTVALGAAAVLRRQRLASTLLTTLGLRG